VAFPTILRIQIQTIHRKEVHPMTYKQKRIQVQQLALQIISLMERHLLEEVAVNLS
jgi:hypothetical protein